jgi:hypothetical protein
MVTAGRFPRAAKTCLPPLAKASALALSGTISCGGMVPPNSWIAAYLTSPDVPMRTETMVAGWSFVALVAASDETT